MLSELNHTRSTYMYSSLPRKLKMNWRGPFSVPEDHTDEPQQPSRNVNIMTDKRVVRGSTLGQHTFLRANPKQNASRQTEIQRRGRARKRAEEYQSRVRLIVGTPPPVQGRLHMDVQTDDFLEEIFLNPETASTASQTDPFDELEPPPFIRPPPGVDAATQILPEELFDFEEELKPIVVALVSRTLDQSLLEIMNENQLKVNVTPKKLTQNEAR
nr:PREDICTED: radial spoke head protein 3 homolog [Bemisia tabaci]